ncbi:MAG TPA: shikimate kinase [Flavipsychrobacter sp.]|nr:shikimate kinase [Flavipsychrobacter sp.]
MSLIFFIGMPGSGKSHWAKKVAAHYQLSSIDLDEYLQQHERMNIGDIFIKQGEEEFRRKENKALISIVENNRHNDAIISCGGGTPYFSNNMDILKRSGHTVYLKGNVNTLLHRLQNEIYHRPLLQKQQDLPKYLEEQLSLRRHVYEQADYILQIEDISLTNFDKIISSCISRQ